MSKIYAVILSLMVLVSMVNAQGNQSANICSKEIKKKQADKKRVQKYCTQAGNYYQKKKKDAPASWYYLLGGSNNKNINEIQKHMTKSNTYRNIGNSYVLKGNYNQAKRLYTQYLKRTSIRNADHNVHYNYKILNKLYPKKKKNLKKGLAIWDKIYLPLANTKTLYNNYQKARKEKKYQEAIRYLSQIIALQKRYQDKENISLWDNLYSSGTAYNSAGQYQKSLGVLHKVEKVYKTNPNRQKWYANLLDWIADDYENLRQYTAAIDYTRRSLRSKKKALGAGDISLAGSYTRLGRLYKAIGDYSKALESYHQALSIQEKVQGKGNISTAERYSSLGALYEVTGNYGKALEYTREALSIRKKALGEAHGDTAISYNNLSNVYANMDDYASAMKNSQKALAIMEKVFGEAHEYTAANYNNLAWLYDAMGNYTQAMKYYRKSMVIREKVLGKEHIDTAESYNNIAMLYQKTGDLPKALEYQLKSLALKEKILGQAHPNTAISYNNIGMLYQSTKEYPKALKYHKKSLVIMERTFGTQHPMVAKNYNNLAFLYESTQDYTGALAYYQKALTTMEKSLGKENTYAPLIYTNMGVLNSRMDNYREARENAQQAFNIFLSHRDKVFAILSSEEKEKYLKANSRYIRFLLLYSNRYLAQLKQNDQTEKAQNLLRSGANAWLNYKGSIFDSENSITMLYASTQDAALKTKIKDLVNSKRDLAKLYQSLPSPKESEAWQKSIQATEAKISQLNREIASKASSFKEQQGLKSISYKDIVSHLKANELYLDFARVGGYYYLFTLDRKEHIEFVQIDRERSAQIDSLIKTFREDITAILNDKKISNEKLKVLTKSSKEKLSQLYSLVIEKPLGDTVKNKTSLIISPDGALRLLPFEALYDKDHSKYLIEQKEIRYIPSGKELVRLYKYSKDKVFKTKKSSVIFSNPNFNTKIASVSKEQTVITPNTNRSGIIKSLFKMRFSPLPGTKEEAKAIKNILGKRVKEYRKNKATESALMKTRKPKILHIATHGFFINDNTIPNPMLKSGIALTGANTSAIKGKSDGIVTALKLSGLDLSGTDLVVLSACQTGVVDINSTDSISGLSKAFIQAGAKDIVISLWSVDDQATKELMTSFYQEMKQNPDYAKALKAAKLKMIEEGRHPFYWGAFVVSGL